MAQGWKEMALAEIASVKPYFIEKHGWRLSTVVEENRVLLYVRLQHKRHPDRLRMLRLAYEPGFPQQRPREEFVNPDNPAEEGRHYWITGHGAFKYDHNPPAICLEGTWGFHEILHRERDPLKASINKLLLEIQLCFDETP